MLGAMQLCQMKPYERNKMVRNFKNSNWIDDCDEAMSTVFRQYQEIGLYNNIYAPKCNLAQISTAASVDNAFKASGQEQFRERIRMFSGYDACYSSNAEKYFNKRDAHKEFHANVNEMLPEKLEVLSCQPTPSSSLKQDLESGFTGI
ncbi:hypothetical protein GUJ93_ZPchr0001g31323 [Zizania palustris]|uniref:Uncharacterized protein n=1 Tax=Zizania palustris TaxID=103762 RepID=A0A8J5RVR1_ZIZPA|nr:hypothetical protein GUJ93_ZPchr0001g33202 [Zizania palustris]KAG8052211.1 hypothetical protein GUJ93_ZPchr0001g31323 [Zizania palustris]